MALVGVVGVNMCHDDSHSNVCFVAHFVVGDGQWRSQFCLFSMSCLEYISLDLFCVVRPSHGAMGQVATALVQRTQDTTAEQQTTTTRWNRSSRPLSKFLV